MNDDSSGKHKPSDARSRSAMLTAALVVGICMGVIAAEGLYLISQERQHPEAVLRSKARKALQTSGDSISLSGATAKRSTGKPRNELEALLQRVAPQGECVKRLPFTNWLVVALDEELREFAKQHDVNAYYRPVVIPDTQKDTGANHATSAMKYQIVREFLELGWDVLLSDVDVVTVQNPFEHLYRDSDVEGMSDGFDDSTAYGAIYGVEDPSMGWSRYAQGTQHMALNSGLFFLRANNRTVDLMKRIDDRLMKEKVWDQSAYNQEIFFLSHGSYKSPQEFMNSKVLFKQVRHTPKAQQPKPVMVHMNYHPNKAERMKAAVDYYVHGNDEALNSFPGGSEPGS
ncbi:hypothetical protein N2152v2_010980 [Parachlorella kessleri]